MVADESPYVRRGRAMAAAAVGRRELVADVTWDVLSERIADLIIVADTAGVIFYASPACRLLGYSQMDLVGRTAFDFVHPDDLEHFHANSAALLTAPVDGAPQGPVDREHRVRRKDGSWVWLEGSPSVIRNGDGAPMGVLNVFRDVTDRRAIRDALWEHARRAAMAEEVTGVGYWRLDAKTREITWSDQIFRIHGLAPGREPALDVAMEMVHPEDRADSNVRVERAITQGVGWDNSLSRIIQRDGSVRYLNGRGVCEKDAAGEVVAVFGTAVDVTEQYLSRQALEDSERRYRLLTEHATDMIAETLPDGRMTYVSPAVERITGYRVREALCLRMWEQVHAEDRQRFLEHYRAVMDGSLGSETTIRYRCRHKQGHWLWLESRPSVVRHKDGTPRNFVDVTREVGPEEALKDQLRGALAQAEQLASVKSEFLANMSHEIRTPLTAMLGFTSLLTERNDLAPAARTHVDRVASAGRALLAIVNDVLDYSKLEAGQVTLNPRATAAAVVGSEAVEMFELQAEAKGLALRFEAAADIPPAVRLDADRLRQVLVNLIGNAVKFTEHGHIAVRMAYDAADARLAIEVADTGPGIAAAAREKLFQRFTQVDGSSTRAKGGTGLGLAISRKLAEMMGGEITLTSRVGRGSIFRLEVAAPATQASALAETVLDAREVLEGVRVLIADDNPINRELARAILEPAGVEVSEAADGQEAVDAAQYMPVDVILMDLRMPRLHGREAAWAIRRTDGPNQDVPILAFSADSEMLSARGEGPFSGPFSGHVGKPISPADLVRALVEALRDPFQTSEEMQRHANG